MSTGKSQTPIKKSNNNTTKYLFDYFGSQAFQRGYQYQEQGRIINQDGIKSENEQWILYSECFGTELEPYKQEITIFKDKIVKSKCTCPVKKDCKHCCASFLQYLRNENFEDTQTVYYKLQKAMKKLTLLQPTVKKVCVGGLVIEYDD